ncbi:MAG TPA: SusD/RagB family nutrient-binding outer membrane lipoprotein, partial [Bacteroidales bacterium]|nr:SusD/RagB family nutrient-binding outer membrane lipoprotein [Bacteroidales bacterium]
MKNKIIFSVILFFGIVGACTDDFEDLNTDKKHPQEVTAAVLVTNAQISMADQISTVNVNYNIWNLMAQYWTERSYIDEANYNIINRAIPDNLFKVWYSTLKDLQDAKNYINEELLEEPNLAAKKINQRNRVAIV